MKVPVRTVLFLLAVLLALPVHAQTLPEPEDPPADPPLVGPIGVPWSRQAAGTAWLPSSTPIFGAAGYINGWSFMVNGIVFAGADVQFGPRGDVKGFSTNWFSFTVRKGILGGLLGIRSRFSLEPATVGESGYPLLLQTGEGFNGRPLVDRQHPNDLTMEVALFYQYPLLSNLAAELYVAAAGEPALGPVGFPLRLSSWGDPFAPIGTQWQDATYISFGVVTAGFYGRRWKLEASVFNGREPDEERTDVEFNPLDSFSTRLTIAPVDDLVVQASFGYLQQPLTFFPNTDIRRFTASAIYNRPIDGGNWQTSFIWGRNVEIGQSSTNAFLLETTFEEDRNVFFGRAEYVQKPGTMLALAAPLNAQTFPMGNFAVGYIRQFGSIFGLVPGVGFRVNVGVIGEELGDLYGARTPFGGAVFVRIRPAVLGKRAKQGERGLMF